MQGFDKLGPDAKVGNDPGPNPMIHASVAIGEFVQGVIWALLIVTAVSMIGLTVTALALFAAYRWIRMRWRR